MLLASESCATFWSWESRVSTTVLPGTCSFSSTTSITSPDEFIVIRRVPSIPLSCDSKASSAPDLPITSSIL